MFLQMVNIEQKKLSKRTMFWVELSVIVLSVLLMFGAFYAVQTADFSENENVRVEGDMDNLADLLVWPMGITVGFEALSLVGGFLLIIMAGAFVAQEYSWGSFQLWLSRGVPRPILLLAKFLVITMVTLLFVFTAVFIGTIISAIFSLNNGGTIPFASVNWLVVLQSILLVTYSLLPYIALAFFLAVIGRSMLVAIGGTLAAVLIIEPILSQLGMVGGGVWEAMVPYLPSNLGEIVSQPILQIPNATKVMEASTQIMSVGTAVLALNVYIILFMAGALFFFQRQDLGG